MKSREFVRDHLTPIGAVLERTDGDHHVYLLPNGRKFVLPMGGGHSEAKPYLLVKLRRMLREPARDEPVPAVDPLYVPKTSYIHVDTETLPDDEWDETVGLLSGHKKSIVPAPVTSDPPTEPKPKLCRRQGPQVLHRWPPPWPHGTAVSVHHGDDYYVDEPKQPELRLPKTTAIVDGAEVKLKDLLTEDVAKLKDLLTEDVAKAPVKPSTVTATGQGTGRWAQVEPPRTRHRSVGSAMRAWAELDQQRRDEGVVGTVAVERRNRRTRRGGRVS